MADVKDYFSKECPELFKKKKERQEGSPTSFTVTEDVIEKLLNRQKKEEGKKGKKKQAPPEPPKPEKKEKLRGPVGELANQEEKWRMIERHLETLHDIKVGTDQTSIENLIASLKSRTRCSIWPCAAGNPVAECLDLNTDRPLNCRDTVMAYTQCVNEYSKRMWTKILKNQKDEE